MKYLEIIADNLSKAGWNWGCVSAVDSNGRTIYVANAHRDDGKRFVVRADEELTGFVELEAAIRAASVHKIKSRAYQMSVTLPATVEPVPLWTRIVFALAISILTTWL